MKQKVVLGGVLTLCGAAVVLLAGTCSAENPHTIGVSANVEQSCILSQSGGGSYSANMTSGTLNSNITGSTFSVTCNDINGWRLMAIGYGNATDGDTDMHAASGSGTIATGTATGSGNPSSWAMSLTAGTGVTLDDNFGNFSAIPSEDTRVAYVSSGKSIGATVSAKYQVYAAPDQAPGIYTGAVKYTLAHPAVPSDITTISNMQEMTTAVCTASTVGQTNQLKDTRDNKYYWIAKLADDNCWMTQNLDFVISTSGTALTTTDSNVTANKTLTATNGWTDTDISFYEGGDNYLPSGTGSATSTTGLAADSTNWHYHVGNYYNWTAATAGSGTRSVTDADATESICPKGWRLPTSNSTTANYSFGKLLTAYSYSSSSDEMLLSGPLWFMRAGRVRDGSLDNQGSNGNVWSSRTYSDSGRAYRLYFGSSNVDPSSDGYRDFGFSVRCVAE